MSDLLLSLFKKEQPWANRSCCSLQKSNREQIALVALLKRATWVIRSWSALSLSKNKQFSGNNWYFLPLIWQFFPAFPLVIRKRKLLPSLYTKEQPWAIHSCCSLKKSDRAIHYFSRANPYLALSLTKNERLTR